MEITPLVGCVRSGGVRHMGDGIIMMTGAICMDDGIIRMTEVGCIEDGITLRKMTEKEGSPAQCASQPLLKM